MGLDLFLSRIDYDGPRARWSYRGFNDFRRRIARDLGFDLDVMAGFGGERPWSEIDDPIVPLLNHSDCEGDLGYEECERVAPRLREIVEKWDADHLVSGYDRMMALRLADMMDEVVEGDAYRVEFR